MRVAFDARVLDLPPLRDSGIGRYTACLLDALGRTGIDLAPLRDLRRPPVPARLAEGWEHVLLAREVTGLRAEVLHQPAIDFVSLRPGAPLVVTLHDLAPLKRPERYLRSGLKHRLRYAAVRRAASVIVPSRAVAADAERLLALERIAVVAEAAAPFFRPHPEARAALERLALPERFLAWVGRLDPPDPRKNVEPLAAAVARGRGLPLVLVGAAGATVRAELEAPGRVQFTGRLSDDELAALYSAAEVLVLPSDDEGFGLPAVEALACGTPVAAYAAGSLPEVLGGVEDAALVETGDVEALLAAAEGLAGRTAQAPRRTWDEVAAETVAVYEEAAG